MARGAGGKGESGMEKMKEELSRTSIEVRIISDSILKEEISSRVLETLTVGGEFQKRDYRSGSGGQHTRDYQRVDYRAGSGG